MQAFHRQFSGSREHRYGRIQSATPLEFFPRERLVRSSTGRSNSMRPALPMTALALHPSR